MRTSNLSLLLATLAAALLPLSACSKKSAPSGATTGATAGATASSPATAGVTTGAKAEGQTTGGAKAPEPPAAKKPAAPLRYARVEPKRIVVEVKDLTEAELKGMEKLGEKYPEQYEVGKHIPLTEAAVPARFRDQKAHVLITTDGAKTSKLLGFLAGHGASEFHFQLVLERPDGLKDERGFGLATPGEDVTGAPTLKAPEVVKLDDEAGGALLSGLSGQAQAAYAERDKMDDGEKKPDAFPKLRAEDVTIIRGRFPAPIASLAIVRVKPAKEDRLHEGQFSAFGLLDKEGSVIKWFSPPRHDLNAQEIMGLVQRPGEPLDHVIYNDSYYEGSYTLMLSPKADGSGFEKPVTLEGDGA